MTRNSKIAWLVGLSIVVALGGLLMRRHGAAVPAPTAANGAPLYWYDPMHPSEHFDKPGKSPFMDMQLLPKYTDSRESVAGSIAVDARVVQNLGVRLAKVEQGSLALVVDTVGEVGVDEHRIEAIQVRQPGLGRATRRARGRRFGPPRATARRRVLAGPAGYAAGVLDCPQFRRPELIEAAARRLALVRFIGETDRAYREDEPGGATCQLLCAI